MEKDFVGWSKSKELIHSTAQAPFYKEREVWWCTFGVNIGHEQDGVGKSYTRPVLIVRRLSRNMFFGVALTSRPKSGRYYLPIGMIENRMATAILSQVRLFDTKRLVRKITTLDNSTFKEVCEALRKTLFATN